MGRFNLSKPASRDLRDVIAWIRKQSPSAAVRVRGEFRKAMATLADFPYIGHERRDLTDQPLRFWALYSYLIIYDPAARPIEIVRIIHGARDVQTMLRR